MSASTHDTTSRRGGGGWEPLRHPEFRRMWVAQFTSNVGSWMQTVAAQWVMISLTNSAVLLSAIPAMGSIPVLLFGIPSGVLGDLVDRRRLILISQALMLVAATVLAVLSALGSLTPWVLLALLFIIGVGSTASAATWQTLQPELVPADDRPQAIALGSVNQNLARAVGPAIGGALLAATSAGLVFGINAFSFVAVLAAVVIARIPVRTNQLPREHVGAAVRAGGRFVANSPVLMALIARAIAFVFLAGAIWALLPLVARHRLGLGSGGYGLLLGCVGVGALLAATYGPALRRVLAPRAVYALSCIAVAGGALLLALTRSVPVCAAALVLAGAAWITGLGLLGGGYQSQLPAWVKARAYAYYLLAFQGANGIGSLCMGAVAQSWGLVTALVVVCSGLGGAALLTWWLPLPGGAETGTTTAEPLPLPDSDFENDGQPVLVIVEYAVRPEAVAAFLALAPQLRRMRRRTGASNWYMHRDLDHHDVYVETFASGSWEEHERQHSRVQHADQDLLKRLDELLISGRPRVARHAQSVQIPRRGVVG